MKPAVRGTVVTLIATGFVDRTGASVTPSAVTFRLDYPDVNRARKQTTLDATLDGTDWTADWDSSVAYPGTVFVSAYATSNNSVRKDDQFQLTAGVANPDPS